MDVDYALQRHTRRRLRAVLRASCAILFASILIGTGDVFLALAIFACVLGTGEVLIADHT